LPESSPLLPAGVSRHGEPTVPPQITYAITDKVLELDGVLQELGRIAERWYSRPCANP
jgi:DNA-binding HxlR family transcriptional regulator